MKTSLKKQAQKKIQIHSQAIHIPAIIGVSQAGSRIKVNFMIDAQLTQALNHYVPNGEKSDFVNKAIEGALRDKARRMASDAMDEFRKSSSFHMTDKEIHKEITYGRK